MTKSLKEVELIGFALLPKEAVCVVQCVRLVIDLLGQTMVGYGEDGHVILADLRQKIIDQVENQRA